MQVRECITTSALLRLPMSMPRAAKLERVEEIIKELVGVRSPRQTWGMCGQVMNGGEGGSLGQRCVQLTHVWAAC